ncbi:hypothetical protein MMC22_000983 [Lobaria immixta]|nr:hypothetical protein [Lobaria immixta]
MADVAATYKALNRWDKAEELQVQVLKAHRKVLGEDHPNTLLSMANLAVTYTALNRLDEAEILGVQIWKGREKFLGAENPHTLSSMANLAWICKEQNHLEKAISLMSDAERLSERVLGVEHLDSQSRRRWLNEWMEESSSQTRVTIPETHPGGTALRNPADPRLSASLSNRRREDFSPSGGRGSTYQGELGAKGADLGEISD